MQHTPMRFDPVTNKMNPAPWIAADYRGYHGHPAWMFNPWSGAPRSPKEICTDPEGLNIQPPGEEIEPCDQCAALAAALEKIKSLAPTHGAIHAVASTALLAHAERG